MKNSNENTVDNEYTSRTDRRVFLKSLGLSASGLSILGPVSASRVVDSESGGDAGDDVWDSMRVKIAQRPRLLSRETLGYRQLVWPERWIGHQFGWTTVGSESIEILEELMEVTKYEFIIDGKNVGDQGDWRYQQIIKEGEGSEQKGWRSVWSYPTPPKSPGMYEYETKITFKRPFEGETSDNGRRLWSGEYSQSGKYEVVHPSLEQITGERN